MFRTSSKNSLAASLSRLLLPITLTLGALVHTSCADFDVQSRIEDLRILAIATEPAEIKYSPIYILAAANQRPPNLELPTYDINVEVFAFEPRGGEMESTFTFCREGVGSACERHDPLAIVEGGQNEDIQEDLRNAYNPRVSEQTVVVDEALPEGRVPGLNYDLRVTPAVIDALIPSDANGQPIPQFFPIEPRVAMSVLNQDIPRTNDEGGRNVFREIAFKRIPFALDFADPLLTPEFRTSIGQAFGVEFCEDPKNFDDYAVGPGDCFYALPANNNPAFLGFQLLDEDDEIVEETVIDGDVDLGSSSLLQANPGNQIRLQPVFAEGTLERQQVVKFDIETSELFIENFFEDLAINWFVTRGNIGQDTTTEQFTQSLENTWTLPSNAQSGERDTLVMVARDQRGGTTVARVIIEYP